jgi:hypothetical protein
MQRVFLLLTSDVHHRAAQERVQANGAEGDLQRFACCKPYLCRESGSLQHNTVKRFKSPTLTASLLYKLINFRDIATQSIIIETISYYKLIWN